MSEEGDREDFALSHGAKFTRDRAEAEAELAAGKTHALEDVVAEDDRLERIKMRWERRRKALPEAAADIDWLTAEVERLLDEVSELKIYRGFGLDHGHERCVAEIKRLTEELGQAKDAR